MFLNKYIFLRGVTLSGMTETGNGTPHFLKISLPYSNRADYAHHITTGTPEFFDLLPSLLQFSDLRDTRKLTKVVQLIVL